MSSFQCESNTFCSTIARLEDFDIFYGEAAVNKLAAAKVFAEHGMDVTVGVYASALPSGSVSLDAFNKIEDDILQSLQDSGGVDGIYLYLHGAMFVKSLGSGEEHLVNRIRKFVGDDVPISLALDFHANNTDKLLRSVNIIQGFRTAPHTDHDETEQRAAKGLVRCLKENATPKAVFVRVPVLAADAAVTGRDPLKSIMEKVRELEQDTAVYSVAFFNGQPWVDVPYVGPCAVISGKKDKADTLLMAANELAQMYWQGRYQLKLGNEAMLIDDALRYAARVENGPIFITDSGDNTTAGAQGEGTLMLHKLLEFGLQKALVCGITAKPVVNELKKKALGEEVDFWVGNNGSGADMIPVHMQGTIKTFGKVLGWAGEECGDGVVIAVQNVDVVFTDVRAAFISERHIQSIGVNPFDYKVIVVKLGYLFPELGKIASEHIFALTPGASTNLFETLDYRNIVRPMYPLDKDFEWEGKIG